MLLNIPYLSQIDGPGAGSFRNDCGPACVAMFLWGIHKQVQISDVYKATGAQGDSYTSGGQLIKAAAKWGMALAGKYHSMDTLTQYLDKGVPYVALVHYGTFSSLGKTESQFRGPHFLNVVGHDAANIIVHDPLWKKTGGKYKAWPKDIFYNAWEQSRLDGNPKFWGLTVVNYTFPVGADNPSPAVPVDQDPRYWGVGIVTTGSLRLRHHAPDGETLYYLKAGDQVNILEPKKDGWYHVLFGSYEGWCGGNPAYITAIQNPPREPVPPPTQAPLFKDLPIDDKMKLIEQHLIAEGLLTSEGRLLG